jgi:hypothetical protein
MDACDLFKQGLESAIAPEMQHDPNSAVADCCDLSKSALDENELSQENFDMDANDQFEQGPESEVGIENQNKPESEVTDGAHRSINVPGVNIGTDVIFPGDLLTAKNMTGKLASRVNCQCVYHDVFIMYLRQFLPSDLCLLKDIIQDIITTSTSPLKRCTKTPIAKFNLEVASWTTTCKATAAGSSSAFEDNFGEDGLSSQSTYKVNLDCLYYNASIAQNPKLLNDLKPSKDQLEKVYGGIMNEVNELRLQIASKNTLSAIDHQGQIFNTNIAKVQATNVFFWPLDDIKLVD